MTSSAPSDARGLVDEPALRSWVGDRLPGEGAFEVERVTSGQSNEIFQLRRGGGRWLLRRPPRVGNAPGAHSMQREYRVLEALAGSGVPHGRGLLLCADESVMGAPFYVMEWLDGVRLYDGLPAELDPVPQRKRIGEELFDALAELHCFDWQPALSDFGRPDGFTERQVSRWMHQLHSYQVREIPALEEAAASLGRAVPTTQRSALIHGDYGLHNVLFEPGAPARLMAIVDWETATIGDPLLDLGFLLTLWLEGPEPTRWKASALPYDVAGFPGRAELAERYADRTGLDLEHIDWYRAVAQLKVACILEGAYARSVRGAYDADGAALGDRVLDHAAYALAIAVGDA